MNDSFGIDFKKAQKEVEQKRNSRPEKGDSLFKPDKDFWNNARLNFLWDHWWCYVDGYKRAGDILVEHINVTRSDQDVLVYPIVFLYRHHFELRLKAIIRDGNRLLGESTTFPTEHNLVKLWKKCREIFKKLRGEKDFEEFKNLDAIEEYIEEFSKVDSSSQAFRYPEDKEGAPALVGLTHINLRHLSEMVGKIAAFFDYVNTAISACLEGI